MKLLTKVFFLLFIFLSSTLKITSALNLTEEEEWNEFLNFQKTHKKVYYSLEELERG